MLLEDKKNEIIWSLLKFVEHVKQLEDEDEIDLLLDKLSKVDDEMLIFCSKKNYEKESSE